VRKWIPRLSRRAAKTCECTVSNSYIFKCFCSRKVCQRHFWHILERNGTRQQQFTALRPSSVVAARINISAGDLYFMRVPQRVKYLRRHAVTLWCRMQPRAKSKNRYGKCARNLKMKILGSKIFFLKKTCHFSAHSNRRFQLHAIAFGIARRAVLLYVLEGFTPSSARRQDNYYCTRLVEGLQPL
jgi:hypothetical protein